MYLTKPCQYCGELKVIIQATAEHYSDPSLTQIIYECHACCRQWALQYRQLEMPLGEARPSADAEEAPAGNTWEKR